jgi:ARG/rhodanese/phosphatase superfamily protein
MPQNAPFTLSRHLPEAPVVGEPDIAGALAVFPLFGPAAKLEYLAFGQAVAGGAAVTERPGAASVNDVVAVNPTPLPVLLYEGQELLGAKQNRTIDVSVLVAPGERVEVPVSCVEQGRWDDARAGEAFAPARHSPHPKLRAMKHRAVAARVAAGGPARAAQGEVWHEVAMTARRLTAHAPTGALNDVFEQRRDALAHAEGTIALHDGQTGMIAAIGGRLAVLDAVGRPQVFAALHGPLVQGYALDALHAAPVGPPPAGAARALLDAVLGAPARACDAVGMGIDVRVRTTSVAASALVADGEVVALTAFPEEPGLGVRRPSLRRT